MIEELIYMSLLKVKEYFKKYDMDDRIIELATSSATVNLAAESLGCEPERIAKTLAFTINDEIILIVMAGDAKIDNAKYKAFFNSKAKMIDINQVDELVGHPVGGVCPFAVNDGIKIYLDNSLKRFETVFPACGSTNSAIELTLKELEEYSNSEKWLDVTKNYNEEASND